MAVKTSRPVHKVVFPPPGHVESYDVKSGDDWGSISKTRCGRSDPWDLIEFNFATRNAAEVNWCLYEYVGCRETNDGKNYCFNDGDRFSSSVDKGKIYLPPPQWKPSLDRPLRKLVVDALAHFATKSINVRRGGFVVNLRSLNTIANHIIDGKIRIYKDDSRPAGTAFYLPKIDTIVLSASGYGGALGKSTLVHECVHAWLDKESYSMNIGTSESIAYVAQTIYLLERAGMRLKGKLPDVSIFDPKFKDLFVLAYYQELLAIKAFEIAKRIIERKPVSAAAWTELDEAIRKHPDYGSRAHKDSGFNGI